MNRILLGLISKRENMPENLREKIKRDEAILADPNASLDEKRTATVDMAIARRFIAKGVEKLPDEESAGT